MNAYPKQLGTTASSLLAVGFAGLLLGACTQASLEPQPTEDSNANALVTVRGTVCTPPPDADGFPVKVVVVVDQSGSMCISDPPGAQESPGFCEQLVTDGIVPPGLTEPARVRALQRLIAQFAPLPNVELAILPFETNVKNVWPPVTTDNRFGPASDPSLDTYVSLLQSQLGKGTDYQGALSYAYAMIASDIEDTVAIRPAILPRTRYVVVFLTDGTPYPRCSANDNLNGYADHQRPQLTWEDSSSARDFCNLLDPDSPDLITGFVAGTDRNQNYQLFSYVERLMELEEKYNVGDIRLHTVLLFNEAAVRNCGPICQDVYGTYPNVATADYPAAAHEIARWTLEQMAQMGNGVFQEFVDGDIQNLGLGALDYSSLRSPNVLKRLLLQNLRAVPFGDKRIPDSDGDGLADELDNDFTQATNPYEGDSDQDCFSDRFEQLHADRGFVPGNSVDIRGCDLSTGLCTCNDNDGDGLNEYEESLLESHTGLVDSDTDGIPDGVEARYRLNLLAGNSNALDTDGDGISDALELLAQTDPTRPDADLFDRDGYKYEIVAQPRGSETDPTCYDYAVSNVRMVSPPSHAGTVAGENLFKVWFSSAPASGVTSDYGEWTVGCAWGRYAPPGIRSPLGPDLDLNDFVTADRLANEDDYRTGCETP